MTEQRLWCPVAQHACRRSCAWWDGEHCAIREAASKLSAWVDAHTPRSYTINGYGTVVQELAGAMALGPADGSAMGGGR